MTIIITCAVIAILIIAVLVSINIRSGSTSSRERVPAVNTTENLEQPASVDPGLKAAAQFTEGPAVEQVEVASTREASIPEVEETGVHVTEPQLNHTADQDFREALRRLKDQPTPTTSTVPANSDKMADDAYRRALRSFKDQPKEEE
ncbi:hypothetical protein D3C71_1682150 [compost metagenome]